jgi:hypothetical protein
MSEDRVPAPAELIYTAKPSAAPAWVAAGLALLVVGIYGHGMVLPNWVYSIIGGVFFLAAVRSWIGATRREVARLPREQRPTTSVLPPQR